MHRRPPGLPQDQPQGTPPLTQSGLSDDPATQQQRIQTYGQNIPVTKEEKTLWEMVELL